MNASRSPLCRLALSLSLSIAAGHAAGCASTGSAQKPSQSLYVRLGGQPAITAVVDDFVARVAADGRINARFANVDLVRLRQLLVEQICQAAGGPCQYTGRDMRSSHAGMQITDADFNALVEDLIGSLNAFAVPAAEQGELLAALGPMKPDIVGVPAGATGSNPTGGAPGAVGAGAAGATGKAGNAISERAEGLREAASLLDKAAAAQARQNRSLAEQLFSSAELIAGSATVADLAPLFREGAPPRITTEAVKVPMDTPAQPIAVGNSDDDEGAAPKPLRGSLSGVVQRDSGAIEGVTVVTLEPTAGGGRKRPPRQRVIEQRQRQFAPRVLAVPVGSTVSFPNFDPIFHNVFSRSEAKPFDLGLYKGGQARELIFDRAGVVRIGCNLHSSMAAFVVVVEAPHYVVTDAQGKFAFRSVAPGTYRLRVYSDRNATPVDQPVTVTAGASTVTVNMGAATPAAPLPDKFGQARVSRPPPPAPRPPGSPAPAKAEELPESNW